MSVTSSVWSSLTLPVIVGAEPDDDNQSNDDNNEQSNGEQGGAQQNNVGDQSKSRSDEDNNGDPQKKITAQQEIIDRKQQKLDEAETELQELRDFKKAAETEKLSAEEKAQRETEELKARNQALENFVQSMVLENAFLTANDYPWHNPKAALKLADLSEVKIVEKDGKFQVENLDTLKEALKKTAEENPYLVKSTEDKWDGKTGDPGKRRQSNQSTNERTRLQNKYPALRNK